jgi:small subunit ribosomal protein S8
MSVSDPIGDLLTRLMNAAKRKHEAVALPWSRTLETLVRVMMAEGYLEKVAVKDGTPKLLTVKLKYLNGKSVLTGIARRSKPGVRVYVDRRRIPWVAGGMGVAVLSTSKGIMSDRQARKLRVGGEVFCEIW